MKSLSSKIYDKNYYLNSNLGYVEFKKYKGKIVHERTSKFVDLLGDIRDLKILDLGCGRGDLAIELARRGAKVVGIDYSIDGIHLAKEVLKNQSKQIQNNVSFKIMSATKLDFNENAFDAVVSFDVFEHLYKDELEIVMKKLTKIIKQDGILLIHTETNKIYLDFTHKFWCYYMDQILININKHASKKNYPGLNKDPRNDLHKAQHVNEPTYFYLKLLFERFKFEGKIKSVVPYKPNLSWKDRIYNVIVYLYPFSNILPLNLLFATEYICFQKKIETHS